MAGCAESGSTNCRVQSEDLRADAASDVATAQRALTYAHNSLALAEDEELDRVGEAQANYRDLFNSWLGIELDSNKLGVSPDELIAGWGLDLERIFDASSRFYDVSRLRSYGKPARR